MPILVGIDVAKETHRVTAVDEQARVVHDGAVANEQAALGALAWRPPEASGRSVARSSSRWT
jgi:hypothetical protein